MIKSTDQKISDALPLTEQEDGVLIVIDREKWQMRLYYEGSPETAMMLTLVLDAAKGILESAADKEKESEEDGIVN